MAEHPRAGPRAAPPPEAPLIATTPFGARRSAASVAAALARGLLAGGAPRVDACPLERRSASARRVSAAASGGSQTLLSLLAELDFDARMRASRALIVAERRLDERTLQRSATFELATRARQAGVPCYAVTSENRLNAFDARMLDLQLILQAGSARALAAAGGRLAQLLYGPQPAPASRGSAARTPASS